MNGLTMEKKLAITKEQVFEAADRIVADGRRPTLSAVRKAIGGGSFTTISESMNEWRARKASLTAPAREPVPPAVADRLTEVGAEIWNLALELANARLASERQNMERQRQEAEQARREAVELADQVAADLDVARARIDALERKQREAEQAAAGLREQLAKALEQAHTAEARAAELRTELDRAHQESAQARQALADARDEAATLRGRLDALREQTRLADKTQRVSDFHD